MTHNAPTARTLITVFMDLGAELPEPVTQSIQNVEALTTAAAAVNVPTAEDIHEAAADAILEGRNPFEDQRVQALAAARSFSDSGALQQGINGVAYNRVIAAFTAHADELVDTLKKEVDAAGAKLTAAHAILGEVDLKDTETILALGPKAAEAWIDAKAANTTIDRLLTGWYWLADLTRFASPSLSPTFRLADLDIDTIQAIGRKANAWAIVKAGGTIDLATRATAKERERRYSAGLKAQAAERDSATQAAVRRKYGTASMHI